MSQPGFEIRPYHSGDKKALNALAVRVFSRYAWAYRDWPILRARIGAMSSLAEAGKIFVAEDGQRLLGAVAYLGPGAGKTGFFRPEWAVMRLLVVAEEVRRQGIGQGLATACLECAKADGATVFALHTSPIMRSALALYRHMGFQFSHAAPAIHGVAYDVYVKALDRQAGEIVAPAGTEETAQGSL